MEISSPPVAEGDVQEVKVDSVGRSGDPVLKFGSYIVFLKLSEDQEVQVGDSVLVKITAIRQNFGFAELA